MENKYVMAKNYNFISDMNLNDYIDCKDTVNHWCVGQISDIDNDKNMVKIHFEGWTTKYDEVLIYFISVISKYIFILTRFWHLQWLKKNSQKLASFRKHTEGYTG